MPVGAIIGAGVLGAGASVASGEIQSKAANKASQLQAQSAQNALNIQHQQFGTAVNALNPFINAGQSALPQLQALLTPGTTQATAIGKNPGLQFQSNWGNMTAGNQLTAEGLGGSGGPLGYALSNYNQSLASTYYGNAVNQLQGLVNTGGLAGSSLASGAINAGQIMGNTAQNIGTAQASGTLGSANALAGSLTGASGGIGNSVLLSQLLGNSSFYGMTPEQINGGASFLGGA